MLKINAEVISVSKENSGYMVTYNYSGKAENIFCDIILSSVPAYIARELFCSIDVNLVKHFDEIYYPPVAVLFLVYKKSAIGQPLDGFGFLIPAKERKLFLGAIWSSVLFPNRAGDDEGGIYFIYRWCKEPGDRKY